jgi:4-amino-4-deoxy-L-arabinose transferase-like glycosyltransferase
MRKPAPKPQKQKMITRLLGWLRRHKLDALLVTVLVIAAGTVSAVNMTGYPQRFEDEGTYVSQAWAIKERGTLAHYTYWYDHPPVGWIQMAGHLTATDAIDRYGSAITAGREFMLLLHLATIVLLYALARRLGLGSIAAGAGTLMYAFSPLVVEFSRYVLLDNVALPWLLAAFLLALSPRKHLATAIGSAVCMVIAILSKETFAALLPVLLYGMWQTGDKRNRRYTIAAFSVIFVMISGFYILYALLKNEFFPGPGHVSILGSLAWQLTGRDGSGSILDPQSGTRSLINYWFNIDYWLMLVGIIALPFAFLYRQLRVVALALLVGVLLVLRGGYLPYPYIIAVLPFAALVFAGVVQYALIHPAKRVTDSLTDGLPARTAILILPVCMLIVIVPAWHAKLSTTLSVDQDASSRQAVDWVAQNIPRNNRLVVESGLWTDLEEDGFNQPDPVWLYKTETDPAIVKEIGGWEGIDYVILNGPTTGSPSFGGAFPTVNEAIKHAKIINEFGTDNQKILIYEVQN